jgi:hypothetical protein
VPLWDREGVQGMVVRASRVALGIAADLRSGRVDASHGVRDGRAAQAIRNKSHPSHSDSPLVVLLGYCFVSASRARFADNRFVAAKKPIPGAAVGCDPPPPDGGNLRRRSRVFEAPPRQSGAAGASIELLLTPPESWQHRVVE